MSGETPKGNIVICINNSRYTKRLTIGKEYLVKGANMGRLLIEDDNGMSDYFRDEMFKLKKLTD